MKEREYLIAGAFCLILGLIQLCFRKPIMVLALRWRDRVWRALGVEQPLTTLEKFMAGPGSIITGWIFVALGALALFVAFL
jgi:hypothetical protein